MYYVLAPTNFVSMCYYTNLQDRQRHTCSMPT